jgi:hypothetical protein
MKYAKLVYLPIETSRAYTNCKCEGCQKPIKKGAKICLTQVAFKFSKRLCYQCAGALLSAYRFKIMKIETAMFGKQGA